MDRASPSENLTKKDSSLLKPVPLLRVILYFSILLSWDFGKKYIVAWTTAKDTISSGEFILT